jgi:SagB-type dehydrogenase family enzyme
MSFIACLRDIEKQKQNVFLHHIFGLDKEVLLFKYLKKVEQKEFKFLFEVFSEKWWTSQLEQVEELTDEEFNELDILLNRKLNTFVRQFEDKSRNNKNLTIEYRNFLKAGFESCGTYSGQVKGFDIPPTKKEITDDAICIDLPKPRSEVVKKESIFYCIQDRESRRKFSDDKLTLDELSYLLWATQGIRRKIYDGRITLRNVPSGGARQPFETYLFIHKVEGLKVGIYRYQVEDHKLVYLFVEEELENKMIEAALGQKFAGECAVCFVWSAIPYRCEWRYTTEAKKIIAQDSGHLCQNLYLAAESINCGTCAIGAYSQSKMDKLFRLDGDDEFVVYVSPVGKVE